MSGKAAVPRIGIAKGEEIRNHCVDRSRAVVGDGVGGVVGASAPHRVGQHKVRNSEVGSSQMYRCRGRVVGLVRFEDSVHVVNHNGKYCRVRSRAGDYHLGGTRCRIAIREVIITRFREDRLIVAFDGFHDSTVADVATIVGDYP